MTVEPPPAEPTFRESGAPGTRPSTIRTPEPSRDDLGIPPLPLDEWQVRAIGRALISLGPGDDPQPLIDLMAHRVAPGVGEAARAKADFLAGVANGEQRCAYIDRRLAVRLLGTMLGGYNVAALVELLKSDETGALAAEQLGRTLLVYDAFEDVARLARSGNPHAEATLRSWAVSEWFTSRTEVAEDLHLTVFKLEGETNTDDISPATHASTRADIPLHARSFLEDRVGPGRAARAIAELKSQGRPVAFVGEVVGTGSSRKSATNSLQWHIGVDIPWVPNRRTGGVVIAGRIAPIFFDTLLDSGALPIECDASAVGLMATGDHIVVKARSGRIETNGGELIGAFRVRDGVLDAVRAGGRIPLVIGRKLRLRAELALQVRPGEGDVARAGDPGSAGICDATTFTAAQKIVGRACGIAGVAPGTYCEPSVSTVGSQDTTGPMNRTELEDLACLSFGADLVLQSFCHTAAYPKPADVETHRTLPRFMGARGAVVLQPGDGIIHSWLNRMLLPDQVGTGSDSHTRFPLGLSFPAGSGLVAFAAATGAMPLTMPESVKVRFVGQRQPGITLRDVVHSIPYTARRSGLLTLDPAGSRNPFSGRIIEIEGLDQLSVEEAFELTDSSAERSAAAAHISLSKQSVVQHLTTGIATLRSLIDAGYQDAGRLQRRVEAMQAWLERPELIRADAGARYAEVVEVDLSSITEPLLACPGHPDDVRPLSEIEGTPVDEVFVGSCMTSLGHFHSAGNLLARSADPVPAKMWVAPPTRLVSEELRSAGYYSLFAAAGARTETPGCSLCMGNQARVAPGATVVSTSTRNFPNRMGRGAAVYLASAEVATLAAIEGRLPTVAEYLAAISPTPASSSRGPASQHAQ